MKDTQQMNLNVTHIADRNFYNTTFGGTIM